MQNSCPPRPAAVTCDRVCVAYDGLDVVHDVTLTVDAGTFLPFVGSNGAGKTTLLRAIIGLLKPSRGTIRADFGGSPPGYVPQQRLIDPLLPISVRQLIAMGMQPELGYWGRPCDAQRKRVDDVLRRFALSAHQDRTFAELSGGMKQKALIARAFISGARVFVMDEPTSELDAESEHDVLSCLLDMTRTDGKTVLLAHHGLDILADLASAVCLMQHGRARIVDVSDVPNVMSRVRRTGTPGAADPCRA